MVWRLADKFGSGSGEGDLRDRVSKMINSVSSAGSGISAVGVDCRLDDVFDAGGAGEVRGSSSSAVCRILARVAFRRRALSSFVSVSKGLWGRIRDSQ